MKITAPVKGFITAAAMIAVFLVLFMIDKEGETRLQYSVYAIYALGIVWAVLAYRKSATFTGKFGDYFSQGFKCFIIVTLCMALFYAIFNAQHPEFAEETAKTYKEQMLKENQKTPTEIESEISTFKKQYTVKLVSGAIFGYLIIGAGVTAVVSVLLSRRK